MLLSQDEFDTRDSFLTNRNVSNGISSFACSLRVLNSGYFDLAIVQVRGYLEVAPRDELDLSREGERVPFLNFPVKYASVRFKQNRARFSRRAIPSEFVPFSPNSLFEDPRIKTKRTRPEVRRNRCKN